MLLTDKTAIVYGGAGGIGSAVARAFAREGAMVHLAGRTLATLEKVAERIRAEGGSAEPSEVDALDGQAVHAHADAVAAKSGGIDIAMNVISHGDVQGTPLVDMTLEDYERPVVNGVRTTFLTSTAVARHMIPRGEGVILFFGGDGDPLRGYNLGGLQVGFSAIEAFRRSLANELGPHGIRVITLRTGGIVETIPAGTDGMDQAVNDITNMTMLGRGATLEDVGNVAAFVASDRARSMTATAVNISCGTIVD
jgi:NAD(P)-dependent dehydrogenase (short-subunit alcohol dehydrogenase family)